MNLASIARLARSRRDLLRLLRVAASHKGSRRSRRGMNLIEVMVVIVIILTLVGLLTWGIFTALGNSQVDMTTIQMTRAAGQIEIYALKKKLPSSGDGLRQIFGEDIPMDAWGEPLVFVTPGPNGMQFDLISKGADKQEGGEGANADIRYSDVKKR